MEDFSDINVARIENETFEGIVSHGVKCCSEMRPLWYLLYGQKESVVVDRYTTILRHVKELFDEMLKEDVDNVEEFKETLSELLAKSRTLQQELSMEIKLPFVVDLEKPDLWNQVKQLQDYLKQYEEIKADRVRRLETFMNMEEELCIKLGEKSKYDAFDSIPSEEDLKEIEQYIRSLDIEEKKRLDTFKSLSSEIEALVQDIENSDEFDSEQQSLSTDNDHIILSKSNLKRLQESKKRLMAEKDKQEQQITVLKERVSLLWNLLDIGSDNRANIINKTHKGCGKTVLSIWTRELERCEILKKENMKIVIQRLRKVIKTLWDDCHLSNDQRNAFIYMQEENYDDRVLQAHEDEEKRLRDYLTVRKDIFALAKKWFTLWEKMVVLENRSLNIDRLNNRGGQLLKEEKERKAVQKELPKVESSLEKMIGEFELRTQGQFLYDGRPLMYVISEYWEKRRAEKENEKESRKMQSRTPLKPKQATGTPASMCSQQKRGRILASAENISAKKTTVRRELKMPSVAQKQLKRRSKSHDPSGRYNNLKKPQAPAIDASLVSYAGFQ